MNKSQNKQWRDCIGVIEVRGRRERMARRVRNWETLPRHGAGTAPVHKHWEEKALPGHKGSSWRGDRQNKHTQNCLTIPKWGYLWTLVSGETKQNLTFCDCTRPNQQCRTWSDGTMGRIVPRWKEYICNNTKTMPLMCIDFGTTQS